MDPLFTFNSLQIIPPSMRKQSLTRMNTPNIIKILCRAEGGQIREEKSVKHRNDISWRHQRKQSIRGEKENIQLGENVGAVMDELAQAVKRCRKKKKGGQSAHLMLSFRYFHHLAEEKDGAKLSGGSTGRTRKPKIQEMSVPSGLIQQQPIKTDYHPRKRTQSVKMSPRIVVPLSDRKLPKVFKVRQLQYLPQIHPLRKYDSLELRQVKSANRSRCSYLHRFHQQLQQLGGVMAEQPFLVPF